MYRYIYNKLIRPIFTINDTPHSIALGVALGVFVSLTPTVGFQMLTVVIIGTFIKANRIIAAVLCWISNPVTTLPMYYGYYWLGATILGLDLWAFKNFSTRIDGFMNDIDRLGYWTSLTKLGSETLLPLWLGSLIIAVVVSIPLYPLTRRALRKHRESKGAMREIDGTVTESKPPAPSSPAPETHQSESTKNPDSPPSRCADVCVPVVKEDE